MWKYKRSNPQKCVLLVMCSMLMASKVNESKPLILMFLPSGETDSKIFVKQELTGERKKIKNTRRGSKLLEGQ